MPLLNTEPIVATIQNKIDNLSTSSGLNEFILPSINNLDIGISTTINSVNDLPDLGQNTIPNGQLIYIKNINIYAISVYQKWKSLDGRLIRDDSTVRTLWAWGTGNFGQLGNNCTSNFSSPVSVVGGFTDWCAVDAGGAHVVALRTNDSRTTLWTWGQANFGQLANTGAVSTSSPVTNNYNFTDWHIVSAGTADTAAIRSNGTLWTWGNGVNGNIAAQITDWCAVSASNSGASAAIRSNGTLWTWGCGSSGELGNNTTISVSSPVSIVGGFTDWCAVSAGSKHIVAVKTNGSLWTWGAGGSGQLGDGFATARSSPVSVVGGFTDWCTVSAGDAHTAAIRTDGSLWTWGFSNNGQLGDGFATARSSPVSVVGGFTDWCSVSAGRYHTAAIRTNGTLWTWGSGGNGELGDGFATARSSPVSVVGGFTDWCAVSTGIAGGGSGRFTIALRISG